MSHPITHRRPDRPGFTLVEILIVVVILGILAAIVIPQFSNATNMARTNTMLEHLRVIRSQIGMYYAQHGSYPKLANMWDAMTGKTDIDGTIDPTGRYGPYFDHAPRHQFNNSSTIVAPGTGTSTDGWEYDETTGQIHAVGFDETTGTFTAPGS